jgi:hypothetical protein
MVRVHDSCGFLGDIVATPGQVNGIGTCLIAKVHHIDIYKCRAGSLRTDGLEFLGLKSTHVILCGHASVEIALGIVGTRSVDLICNWFMVLHIYMVEMIGKRVEDLEFDHWGTTKVIVFGPEDLEHGCGRGYGTWGLEIKRYRRCDAAVRRSGDWSLDGFNAGYMRKSNSEEQCQLVVDIHLICERISGKDGLNQNYANGKSAKKHASLYSCRFSKAIPVLEL